MNLVNFAYFANRQLLTNDDGPPNEKESPFIYGFAKAIRDQLGWETFVVIPSSQKSWYGLLSCCSFAVS